MQGNSHAMFVGHATFPKKHDANLILGSQQGKKDGCRRLKRRADSTAGVLLSSPVPNDVHEVLLT